MMMILYRLVGTDVHLEFLHVSVVDKPLAIWDLR